jgi:hypothetical protein
MPGLVAIAPVVDVSITRTLVTCVKMLLTRSWLHIHIHARDRPEGSELKAKLIITNFSATRYIRSS